MTTTIAPPGNTSFPLDPHEHPHEHPHEYPQESLRPSPPDPARDREPLSALAPTSDSAAPVACFWVGPHACPHCDETHIVQINHEPERHRKYRFTCPLTGRPGTCEAFSVHFRPCSHRLSMAVEAD